MASGAVLQMDQTAPEDQTFLRDIGECCEDPNLDRGECLRPGRNHQKGIGARNLTLHFLQILSVRPFEKTQISSAFLDVDDSVETPVPPNQLNLFQL
jgi:hypothetical protein